MPPDHHEEEKIERLRRAMYSRKYADQLGPRERRAMDAGHEEVAEDWEHSDLAKDAPVILPLDAMTASEAPSRVRTILKWILLASAVFFVAAIVFFVYYLFFGGASAISSKNIDLVITGPSEIQGGEVTNLQLTITNRNKEALQLADVVVTYPAGTKLDPTSCTYQTCRITIGTIAAGGTEVIKLPAVYEGTAGQTADVSAELEYRLGDSDSIFVASSDYPFVFSSSPLSVAVAGNTQTISGQPMEITVTVSSNVDQSVDDVLMSAAYPFGFTVSSATPAPDANGLWELGTLAPGDQKTITIDGTLSGTVNDTRIFQFTAGTESSATSTSIDTPLSNTTLAVAITQPFLDLGISVNGSTSTSNAIAVSPGDIVNVSIAYQNNLSSAIENAVIVAKLSGISIDGTTVQSQDGFYRSTDNSVLWDQTTTNGILGNLAAGASGTLGFTFQVPAASALAGIQNPNLTISVSAAGTRVGQSNVPENLQSTAQQNVVVASDLSLSSQGLYYTDPFGASGPMPPSAGTETTYAVQLSITNTTNEITGGQVTATLPPYVRLVGNHYFPASESVSFNENTGVFTWNVGDIAPGVGLNGTSPRQVVIELGFTPSTSQIGSTPVLLQDITLTGTDSSTGDSVSKSASDVTTNITGDPGFSSVNSKVVK